MATSTTRGTPGSPDPSVIGQKPAPPTGAPAKPSGTASPSSSSSSSSPSEEAKKLAEEVKGKTSSVRNFVAGGVGGVCAVLVGQPFDLVKVRLQTAPDGAYAGAMDVARKTYAKDGVTGFYKGMSSPLVGVTPMFAVSFWGYAMGKKIVYAATGGDQNRILTISELAVAGALSAVPMAYVAAPVERVKVLMQIDGQKPNPQYKGALDVVKQLYKEGGVRALFRGTVATIARDSPGSAAYFAAYEATKHALTPAGQDPGDLNLGSVCVAGGAAGVAMWSIAIPPDTIKSRLQGAPAGTYSGFMDCARQLVAKDGMGALFKGLGPAMVRAVPANAATFLGYEVAMKAMNKAAPPPAIDVAKS